MLGYEASRWHWNILLQCHMHSISSIQPIRLLDVKNSNSPGKSDFLMTLTAPASHCEPDFICPCNFLLAILIYIITFLLAALFSFLRRLGPISRRRSLLVFVSRVRDQRLASRVELLVEGTHRWFPWKSSTFTWLEIFMLLLPQTTCLVSHMTDYLTDQEQPYTYIHTYIRAYTHTHIL